MWWKLLLTLSVVLAVSLGGSNVIAGGSQVIATADGRQFIAIAPGSVKLAHGYAISSTPSPQELYHKVWHLIKEDFYLPTYNDQDWGRWEHRYDGKLKTLEDSHRAIETMLASLGDRYTRFLDHDQFDDEKSQISAKLFGIGIQIGVSKDHRIVVISPIDDTPAQRAGLQAADEIAEIDGKSTKGFSVEDAAKHIRGKVNTAVRLTILRNKQKKQFRVVRAEIPIKAVQTAKMLDSDVGYIRLSSFISQEANREMRDALRSLSKAHGIILDLRDNPGGLLTNAIDISNMFLESGNIVSTVDRDGYKQPQQCDGKPICKQPLVVLVNRGSASASEITSGALRDNGRATLVGQKTFGKGLVQGINKLEDGTGVNITIAKYLTPNDTDINKKGIGPDVDVEVSDKDMKEGRGEWWLDPDAPNVRRSPEDMKDVQLKTALQVLKKKLVEPNTPVAIKAATN